MSRLSRKLGLRSPGPPPVVVGLLAVELVAVVVFLVLGTSLGAVLKSAGLPIALTLPFSTRQSRSLDDAGPSCPSLPRRPTAMAW